MAVNRTLAAVLVGLTVVVVGVVLAGGFGELRPTAGPAEDATVNRSATTTAVDAAATGTQTTATAPARTKDATTPARAPTAAADEQENSRSPAVARTSAAPPPSTTPTVQTTDTPPTTTTLQTTTSTTPATSTTASASSPPAFVISIDSVTECGTTCRDVTVTLTNRGGTTATDVTVTTTVSTAGEPVWAGSESVGTLAPGETYTTSRRVALSYLEALQVVDNDGWVTITVVVASDQRTQTFTREEQVL